MSKKQFYTVPFVWDKTLWAMTFACFALWIGLSGWFVFQIFTTDNDSAMIGSLIILNIVFIPTILACEGLAPQRLEVGESQIVVLRRYNSVVIRRDEVKSVERLPDNALRGAIRTGGVGGLFGYFGRYYSRSIGSFSLYATNSKDLFLIRKWDGKNIVINCAEPDKMEIFI